MLTTALVALAKPWPWYIAGPLIGLFVPVLLLVGNRMFGVSSNLRHACAVAVPGRVEFFRYDWRSAGSWNLAFALGILGAGRPVLRQPLVLGPAVLAPQVAAVVRPRPLALPI